MSRMYGTVDGAGKTTATRRGHRRITTHAATWNGAIRVTITLDENDQEVFTVEQVRWHGAGVSEVVATGVIGQAKPQEG